MTSGVFHLIPTDKIVVKRDERQRRELEDIDILADSIRRLGLIHPLVVTRDGLELVAGERRYAACKQLGWPNIPVQYVDEVEPHILQAIELEENIKRSDILWQDQVTAVGKYHKDRTAKDSEWTTLSTADALGITRQHANLMIALSKEISSGKNKLIIEAPKLSTAIGVMQRSKEREDRQIIERLHQTLNPKGEPQTESILVKDFRDWVLGYTGVRFNFIHCDFPYGIEADTFNQGSAPSFGAYDDTRETWERLMMALEIATRDACTESCHLMFWFSMRKGNERLYEPTANWLERMGWSVNPMPLIWMKSDGVGILPDPQRGPRQIYETCFLASRGDRKIVRAKANAYHCPTDAKQHMSTKPEPMLRHFFEMLVDENTIMLDPTCGSGSALRAAESLGAKHVLGLEMNATFAEDARNALKRFRTLRKATTT